VVHGRDHERVDVVHKIASPKIFPDDKKYWLEPNLKTNPKCFQEVAWNYKNHGIDN